MRGNFNVLVHRFDVRMFGHSFECTRAGIVSISCRKQNRIITMMNISFWIFQRISRSKERPIGTENSNSIYRLLHWANNNSITLHIVWHKCRHPFGYSLQLLHNCACACSSAVYSNERKLNWKERVTTTLRLNAPSNACAAHGKKTGTA